MPGINIWTVGRRTKASVHPDDIPVGELVNLLEISRKVLASKKAVQYICTHASSIYAQKDLMHAIRQVSKMNKMLVEKSFDRSEEECGEP